MRGMMVFAGVALLAGAAACNDNGITAGAGETPTPIESATTPPATPTPVPCQFYGIDSASNLWIIDPVAITAHTVGATGVASMTDIAITPDDRIIGITKTKAYEIDPSNAHATEIASSAWLTNQDALDALPDGRLLVGGDADLVAVDLSTGAKENVGSISGGRVFSGDVAAEGTGTALGSAKVTSGTANDHLVSFNVATHAVNDLGDLGYPKVFGLDYGCDGNLYGMVAQTPPLLLKVNPVSGATTLLGTMTGGPTTLWGAAGPAGN